MKLGERIKQLLGERKETQRDLARRFGWGDSTVSQYVKGEREPDLETVGKLAKYFEVTVDYMLGRTSNRLETLDPHLPDNWEQLFRSLSQQGIAPQDVENAIELIKTYKKMREG